MYDQLRGDDDIHHADYIDYDPDEYRVYADYDDAWDDDYAGDYDDDLFTFHATGQAEGSGSAGSEETASFEEERSAALHRGPASADRASRGFLARLWNRRS